MGIVSAIESIRDSLGDICRQDFPVLNVSPGPWSYRVIEVRADGRCDLQAVKKGPPPKIANVDHWTSSGAASKPVLGSTVVVAFLDGDPGFPMIGAYTPLRVAGGAPAEATLDATTIKIGPTEADAIELAGGGRAASGVGHACGQLVIVHVPPAAATLWYRPADGDNYVAVATSPVPPTSSVAGTPIYIVEGSSKVSID